MTCYNFCHPGNVAGSVYISGTTCGFGIGAFYLTSGQCICLDVDESYITCDSPVLSGSCAPPTPTPTTTTTQTPSVTPTQTSTATPTQTSTATPTQTNTPTSTLPAVTPTQTTTQTQTPSQTATNTQTPSVTPTNTTTPSVTPTKTATNTPTPSITPTSTSACTNCYDVVYFTFTGTTAENRIAYRQCDGIIKNITGGYVAGSYVIQNQCSGANGVDINGFISGGTGYVLGSWGVSGSTCCPATPTPTPTQTQTPSVTPTKTQTPSVTATQTQTPSSTPNCANCVNSFQITASTSPFTINYKNCLGQDKTFSSSTITADVVGSCSTLDTSFDVNSISVQAPATIIAITYGSNCCPVTPTPTTTQTQTSTPSQTATQTNTPSQTATNTPTPSTTPPSCVCYYFQNEDSSQSSIFWTPCGSETETSEVLGAGQVVRKCVNSAATAPSYTGGVTTIAPCSSVTTCSIDADCSGCT